MIRCINCCLPEAWVPDPRCVWHFTCDRALQCPDSALSRKWQSEHRYFLWF